MYTVYFRLFVPRGGGAGVQYINLKNKICLYRYSFVEMKREIFSKEQCRLAPRKHWSFGKMPGRVNKKIQKSIKDSLEKVYRPLENILCFTATDEWRFTHFIL